jgi:hypothetical protein
VIREARRVLEAVPPGSNSVVENGSVHRL